MSRHPLGWMLVVAVVLAMAGCGTGGLGADRAAYGAARSAHRSSVSAGIGSAIQPPAARPRSPQPTPAPGDGHPAPIPVGHRARPTPASAISAASLGIHGAGTLKIPAWPGRSSTHWHGPADSQGSTGTSSVALTFDDGPGPYTSQVLDLLEHYHVKATFCLIGRQIHGYASVVRRMIKDGMTLCNHSWDHDEKLGTHTPQYIAANLQRTINALHAIDPDATMAYFRNPGGNFTPTTVRVGELLGMRPLYWNVDTEDWTRPGVTAIEKSVASQTHRGSIVLMHDGGGDRSETLAALRTVLPTLRDRYRLIALPTARTVAVDPGTPAPQPSVAPSTTPPASSPAPSQLVPSRSGASDDAADRR